MGGTARLDGDRRLGILTDAGHITNHIVERFDGLHGLLLEFNHDSDMLWQGDYPEHLKHRVGGDWGHLNNRQSAALLERVLHAELKHVVVAHISEQNNHRDHVEDALGRVLDTEHIIWADQESGFDWLRLG